MEKLSVEKIHSRLFETSEVKKAKYETMKKPSLSMQEFASKVRPGDPATKITKVKQVEANGLASPKEDKGKPFVPEADRADVIVDRQKNPGIFSAKETGGKSPAAPSVERIKPNQTTKQKEVKPSMPADTKKQPQYYSQAPSASSIVDALPVGDIFSENDSVPTVRTPTAKNLGATTRVTPKTASKPKMGQDPTMSPKANPASFSKQTMPSDAPKKPSWGNVKSGVAVRVNEHVKATFDIVSGDVLNRLVEQYQQHGYRTEVVSTEPGWKSDRQFLSLVREAVMAKMNHVIGPHRELRESAFKRLYALCKGDFNGLYESREDFVSTVREAFKKIEIMAETMILDSFQPFAGKVRLQTKEGLQEAELITLASDEHMALRQLRHAVMENFGLDSQILHLYVDGKKFVPSQIQDWAKR